MKRWLKKHGKWIIVGLGVLFIANGGWAIFTTTEEWKVTLHACAIILWLAVILVISGAFEKLFKWWEKD